MIGRIKTILAGALALAAAIFAALFYKEKAGREKDKRRAAQATLKGERRANRANQEGQKRGQNELEKARARRRVRRTK